MFRRSVKLAIALVLIVSHVMLLAGNATAAAPTLSLIVNPAQTDVDAGSDPVALTAKASGTGLKFKWELQGPGEIDGTGSAVFYKIPETIEGESERAIITVTVTDEAGAEVVETVIFNILASKTPEKKAATATPPPAEPKKKGMSTGTKVAIGVGAAALIGGGVALAMSGDDDDDKDEGPKFTGTFVLSYLDTVQGYATQDSLTFVLNQSDSSVTGSLTFSSYLVGCCTASCSSSVTGNVVADLTADLSWPQSAPAPRCSCSWASYGGFALAANSERFTLANNGNILRSESGAEWSRQAKVKLYDGDEEVLGDGLLIIPGGGDFIRQ